jgi:hypothetical protein
MTYILFSQQDDIQFFKSGFSKTMAVTGRRVEKPFEVVILCLA